MQNPLAAAYLHQVQAAQHGNDLGGASGVVPERALVQQLTDMGFAGPRAQRACLATKNAGGDE